MVRIPINDLVFSILYWDMRTNCSGDIDEFNNEYDFDDFSELYPNKELELGDKYNIIKDFLEKNIEIIDEIEEYTDLEKGYSEKVLIIKYNNKFYGIDFFQSPHVGAELIGLGRFIDECPEYKEVQVTTYQLK